jgi:steroid delta-isomerase-like uncharacterized protein
MTNLEKKKSISVIQEYYVYFNHENTHHLLALLDDKVIHDINQGSTEVGKPAFTQFMRSMNVHYKEKVKDLVIMATEDGSSAAATFIVEGIYLKTAPGLPQAFGQTYALPCGSFFKLKNGKITHMTVYYNLSDWIKQVSEQ